VQVAGAPGWFGTIKGLGLVVTGALPEPVRVRGVIAKPMGALEVLGDRLAEWLSLESWTGTSINVVVGGADMQDLPMPIAVAAVVGLAALLLCALHLRREWVPDVARGVAAVFIVGWLLLDLRWAANLSRQVGLTWTAYAGKTEREKQLAGADGELFAFVERARAALPAAPQRVWVASDQPYFNGRAAYHLYPHNVEFDPRGRAMPDRSWLRTGDWLLVFARRGVEYDAARAMLRWDGQPELAADIKARGDHAGLFLIR
jgi:hypothetical protein